MGAHGGAQEALRLGQLLGRFGAAEGFVSLEREFGVDDDGAGRFGQVDKAIGAAAVGQGGLKGEAVGRQGLLHDVGELDFPEGTARLLVREDVLQREDVAGEFFDIDLRAVDGFQPLLEFAQAAGGAGGGAVQRLGHLALHIGEALFHELEHGGLADRGGLGDVVQTAGEAFLPFGEGLDAVGHPFHLPQERVGHAGRACGGAQGEEEDEDERQKDAARDEDRRVVPGVGGAEDVHHRLPKSRSISDSLSST